MPPREKLPPVALTVAGSDCSAGAGLQADLKTFTAMGAYGLTVVTCVVSEVPGRVNRVQPVTPAVVADQLSLLLESYPVAAAKSGMLYSREIVKATAAVFAGLPAIRRPKLVVDPVMVATSGDPLLKPDAVKAYGDRLFPLADLLTPNMDEARALLGAEVRTIDDLRGAAEALHRRYGCAVIVKGGHLRGGRAIDVLHDTDGMAEWTAPRVPGVRTHGTGCTFSAAIAAGLAEGLALRQAIARAKEFVGRALAQSFRWGRGAGRMDALDHAGAWRISGDPAADAP